VHDAGFVVVGYVLTAAGLGGYIIALLARGRRARLRAAAIEARRAARPARP
jgi:hypothetical protein